MTDNQETTNVAVDEPIRQNLVDTAVHFLLNPEVQTKPEGNKTAFLKKKGLTDAEIAVAFEKAGRDPRYVATVQQRDIFKQNLPPSLPPVKAYSFWSRFNSISTSIIILGVALFGLHRFYQLYIEPWLFGKENETNRLILVEKQLTEVNCSVEQLKQTISALEETINDQKMKIDKFVQNEMSEYLPTPLVLQDLKAEVGAIKSILLSRHQFPAVPKFNTTIPAWQLPNTEENAEQDPEIKMEKKEEADIVSPESAADDILDDVSIINGSSSSEHDIAVIDSPESIKNV